MSGCLIPDRRWTITASDVKLAEADNRKLNSVFACSNKVNERGTFTDAPRLYLKIIVQSRIFVVLVVVPSKKKSSTY